MPHKDPEARRAYTTAYRAREHDEICAQKRAHYAANRERLIAVARAQYLANTEQRKAYARDYYKTNLDRQRAIQTDYRVANADSISAQRKGRRSESPGIIKAREMLFRARKLRAIPSWFGELDELVMQEAAALAAARTKATGYEWHVDHYYPLRGKHVSGLHCAANINVIPATENRKKGSKLVDTRYVFGIALPADANQAG